MLPARCPGWAGLALLIGGCGSGSAPPAAPLPVAGADSAARDSAPQLSPSASLPPVPEARGPLTLRVVYPPAGGLVHARDSSFIFGSTGTGDARVTIKGLPVRVWPNGAWLAWVPLPPDSLMRFRIEARTDSSVAAIDHEVRRGGFRAPPPPAPVWIDTRSLAPRGRIWWPRDQYLALSLQASQGAQVRLVLTDGTIVPLAPAPVQEAVTGAVRAFDRDTANLSAPIIHDRYAGVLRGRAVGPDPGAVFPPLPPPPMNAAAAGTAPMTAPVGCGSTPCAVPAFDSLPPDSAWAVVEAIRGADTARTRWPLQLALLDTVAPVAELDDDSARVGTTDSVTVGRALPEGTYHWFFPTGTRAVVSGRVNDNLRLRLSSAAEAWVALGDARGVEEAIVTPAVVGSITLTPRRDRVTARIPLTRRVPFKVTEHDRSLVIRFYGAVGDVNWIRYGSADSLVRGVSWAQAAVDEVTLTFELARPVWGYRARWDRG
ncbi:MAG: hypothetical protein H0T68_14790, partial [Gemmatimonadales bacterium]|nr:hypothetical protein [Gemmatimonadales bacterium]